MSLRRRLHGATLLIALVAAALLVPAVPASAAPPPAIYNLKNDYRNLACLAGRTNGDITTSQCVDAFTDQYWRLIPAPPAGYYMLQNQISGFCMAMLTSTNGARPFMTTCFSDFYSPEYWALDPTSLGDSFMLRNYRTQKCLVALHANGYATQFTCTFDFHDQWWHFVQRG